MKLLLRLQAKTLAENYGAGLDTGEKIPLLAELSNAVDLKNPRPVPPDNGAIEKKQGLHVYTTFGLNQSRRYLLRLSKKLTLSIISFLIFVFINPPKITHNQL